MKLLVKTIIVFGAVFMAGDIPVLKATMNEIANTAGAQVYYVVNRVPGFGVAHGGVIRIPGFERHTLMPKVPITHGFPPPVLQQPFHGHVHKEGNPIVNQQKEENEILGRQKEENPIINQQKEENALLTRQKEGNPIVDQQKEENEILGRQKEGKEVFGFPPG